MKRLAGHRPKSFSFLWRRSSLWVMLVLLVLTMLATLVWLAGRYEASQVQAKVERDAADAVSDVLVTLTRNVQNLQALQALNPSISGWPDQATELLRAHRELLRLEWRDPALGIMAYADSPFRQPVFNRIGRPNAQGEGVLACNNARRFAGPAYSPSYFLPQEDGVGQEVMDLCLPLSTGARISGFVVVTYSLPAVLSDVLGPQLTRGQEVSFTETDGTRLALHGSTRRGSRIFTAQQVINLPGNTLLLRLDSWRAGPDIFPNVLTALVTVLSIALLSVVAMLGRDMRRRMQAERNLADALAFRKAMEDSLVTGLLARDTRGLVRYVNPAFCHMVGYAAEELLSPEGGPQAPTKEEAAQGRGAVGLAPPPPPPSLVNAPAEPPPRFAPVPRPLPFWPMDAMQDYQRRQSARGTDTQMAREGLETIFQRKDGARFPVMIFEAPLINAMGTQTGWMSAFIDLSEQRRIEEVSRASQERLQASARLATVGEMASLLSHELNQPLAAISSYATGSLNLLDADPHEAMPGGLTQADLQMAFHRIAEQAERAGKVIKSVHNFVRRREGERGPVHPKSLLDAVMPLVSLRAQKLGVQVHLQVAQELPVIVCDRTMVEQVLLNLARNGMQAMEGVALKDRHLFLGIEHDAIAEGVRFSVTDCGIGITEEVSRQLFTPFFTTKAEGMGLGLSLCRTVVEQHGGNLVFQNRHPQGTIFSFTLPVRATAP